MPRSKNPFVTKKLEQNGQEKTRKPTRFKPGTVALRQIRKAQKNTKSSFPNAAFGRLVRELLHNIDDKRFADFRITQSALRALQETAESWLTGLYRESNRSARNAKRVKITAGDFRLVHDLVMCKGLDELMNESLRYNFHGVTTYYPPTAEETAENKGADKAAAKSTKKEN